MKKSIKQLITVISAAVLGGFLLAFFLISYYNPSGQYVAGQTILAPDIIEKINFKDKHPQTNQNVSFVFDHTEFVFFDFLRGNWQQKQISPASYNTFYQTIHSDSSLSEIKSDVLELFQKTTPMALVTSVRTDVSPTAKIFQVVQFSKEGYYRVKLHADRSEGEWAYFYHSDLHQIIMNIFVNEMK